MTSSSIIRTGWRYQIRHPWQTTLMILGIILGVAMVVSIDIANVSAERAFELSTEAVAGRTTHQISGGPGGLPESVYTTLRVNGILEKAAPVVSEFITSPDLGNRPLQLLGVDPFAESDVREYLFGEPSGDLTILGPLLTGPDTILLPLGLAEEFGFSNCPVHNQSESPACEIELDISGRTQTVLIAGIIQPSEEDQRLEFSQQALGEIILTDIATAQELTGRIGYLDRIDLILPEDCLQRAGPRTKSVPPECPEIARIHAHLPPGVSLISVEARTGNLSDMAAAFKLNLTALSLLALIVGMFLIYNTMTFSVLQRRQVFGILRSIGVTRRELFLLILGEAFVVGVIGSIAGIMLGILLGQGAVRLVTQTINDLYFVVSVRGIQIPGISLIKGALLGTFATLLSAFPPAWEAASSPPRGVLARAVIEDKARRAVLIASWIGAALLLAGIILLGIPSRDLVASFAGTFGVIVGFAMLAPIATRILMAALIRILGKTSGALGRMAPRDVIQSLSRTAVAVAALTIAVSVTIGISLLVGSFRNTIITWLDETLAGDVYISLPSIGGSPSSGSVDPDVIQISRSFPGVERVDALRSVNVGSPSGSIHVAATDNPTLVFERIFLDRTGSLETVDDALDAGSILISEPLANRLVLNRRPTSLELVTDTGLVEFPIAGIYYDYASSLGTVLMRLSTYRKHWSDQGVSALALRLHPTRDPEQISRELVSHFSTIQKVQVRPNRVLRQDALEVFDRTFAITRALRLLALIVAFIGILSALLSWQIEKQRELGILRAVGLTIRQVWALVLAETGLLGCVAGVLAIPTGLVMAWILIYIINLRSFGWTLQMQVDAWPFILAFVISVGASMLAGIIPARRLSQIQTSEALRSE